MVGSVREILQIKTSEKLQEAFYNYEEGLDALLAELETDLAKDILSPDVTDIMRHMTKVESRRVVVAKQLYLVTGFHEYAKSSRFALPPGRGTTETVRDQWKKTLAGPFSALQIRLEQLISGVDSRVNMCKKKLGMEGSVEGVRSNSRYAA